jgi:predicted MFS family arabinose efflux permease
MRELARRFGRYATILRSPGVPVPVVGTLLASLPIGMLGLAILLLVRSAGGGFAAAGTVVAVFGIGTGLGIVVQGRLIDRFGPRPVLLTAAGTQSLALLSIAAATSTVDSSWLIAGVAFVSGFAEPQAGSALRAMWPTLVTREQRPVASALSSILFEFPVVAGPLLLALLVRGSSAQVVIVVAAVLSVTGASLVALSGAGGRQRRVPDRPRGLFGPLTVPRVRTIAAVMAAQGTAIGLLQVSCAAHFNDRSSAGDAGLLYALLSVGSLIGTALYGAWARPAPHRSQLTALLTGLAVTLLGAAFAPGIAILAGSVFASGLLVGPISVRCFTDVDRHAPAGALAAASTTLIATGLAATSAGTALAGWLIDTEGPTTALLAAASCALLAGMLLGPRLADHPEQ